MTRMGCIPKILLISRYNILVLSDLVEFFFKKDFHCASGRVLRKLEGDSYLNQVFMIIMVLKVLLLTESKFLFINV